jgi:hypothetical protein
MLQLARLLMIIGASLLGIGLLLYGMARAGLSFGSLPGNIRIQGSNFTCVFALGASIVLSVLLTLILNIVVRFLNK